MGTLLYISWILLGCLTGRDASPEHMKFVVSPSETMLHEDHMLTLTCNADGPPKASINYPASYEWVKDGKVIPSETEQTLTLEKLSGQDDGNYQCGPSGSDVYREVFHLDVIRGEKSPLHETIFYVDKYGSTLLGRTARLRCYFFGPLGTKHSSYVWVKDGKVIPGATERDIHFQSLSSSDSGDYQCADPSMDVPRRNYHLQVISKIPRPDIFNDRQPACGYQLSLNCLIMDGYTVNEDAVYTWYKDSAEMKGHSGGVLWFDRVTEADTGRYRCTARDGPMDTTSHHSEAFDLSPLIAPKVFIKPSNPDSMVKGIQGEKINLTCVVTKAYPRVPYNGYSWTFLPSNQGPVQVLPLTKKTLTLDPLTRNHSGQYTCQARNDQDFETVTLIGKASVTLDVVYLENIFLTPDQLVNKSDQVTLSCTVESHPTAHLAWFVNGQEVRHVIDNQDHYFIHSAACWDSVNYTCTASNADIPNLTKNATTHLVVQCNGDVQQNATKHVTILTGVVSSLVFSLPDKMTMIVVHPSGQDMVIVHPNCSFLISSAFLPRSLHPSCDPERHHFSFTLIEVTESDEGNYSCMEGGKPRRQIPNCGATLFLRQNSHGKWKELQIPLAVGFIIMTIAVITCCSLKIKNRNKTLKQKKVLSESWIEGWFKSKKDDLSRLFDSLYKNGKVYIIPKLIPSEHQPTADDEKTEIASTAPRLSHGADVDPEFDVLNHVRFTLQQLTSEKDLPSFVLHNTNIGKDEKIILILNRKLGVVLMSVKTTKENMHEPFIEKAANCLVETRKAVREALQGLVKPEGVTAVLVLPDTSEVDKDKVEIHLRSTTDVEMLFGNNRKDFQQWAERLKGRGDSNVWDLTNAGLDSPDITFKVATSTFLTLAGCSQPGKSLRHPTAADSQFLSPDHMEVRDNLAKLLHVWGPAGEGNTMLLIPRAIRWLADEKAVVVVVPKDVYDQKVSFVLEDMMMQHQAKHTKFRLCHTQKEMEVSLKELQMSYPSAEICIIISVLHWPGMHKSLIDAVNSKQISAAVSIFTENLPKFDPNLSTECSNWGWESVHLQEIQHSEDREMLSNLLMTGSSDQELVVGSSITKTKLNAKWKVIDHCRHQDFNSDKSYLFSRCLQCKDELIPNWPLSHQDWNHWIAFHTGKQHLDLQPLCDMLQGLGMPAVLTNKDDKKTDTSPAAAGVSLMRVFDNLDVKRKSVLVVHQDDRDKRPDSQSQDRSLRLEEHKQHWIQAASYSTGQVILLLLTPSPARTLLNLPDPSVLA